MKKLKLSFVSLVAVILNGCGNGSNSTNIPNQQPPAGPVSYQYIIDSYAIAAKKSYFQHKQLSSVTNATCGTAADDIGAVTGIFAFLPVVGPALGSVSALENYVGAGAGSSCMTQQLNAINQNLAYQESQIQTLQVGVSYFANQFAQDNYTSATAISGLAQLSYSDSLSYFIGNNDGSSGLFANTMIDIGFWSQSRQAYQVNESEIGLSTVYKINPSSSDQTAFQQNFANFSGLGYDNTCTVDCYKTINKNSSTALMLTLSDLYEQANANIATYMTTTNSSSTNIVSIVDNYNNTINGIYVQAVNALQQAYALEYLVNFSNYEYINNSFFARGITNPPIGDILQADSYGQVPGTLFSYIDLYNSLGTYPTESQTVSAYNQAQQQLTLTYAAAANQMYQIFMSYTLSDNLIGNQTFPSSSAVTYTLPNGVSQTYNNNINYASVINMANNVNNNTILARPLSMLSLENLSIQNLSSPSYMVYQYEVNNVNQCLTALDRYNTNTTNPNFIDLVSNQGFNCSSVYNNSTTSPSFIGSYLPAQQLELFYTNSATMSPISLMSPNFNNLANTPVTFSGNVYNISAYSLSMMSYNNNNYLLNNLYNQAYSDATSVNNGSWINGWTELNSAPTLDAYSSGNSFYYSYIPFVFKNLYSNGYLPNYLLETATIYGSDPGIIKQGAGQLGYFNITSVPTAEIYFNPMGSGAYGEVSCGNSMSIIYYTLPDGTPISLAMLLAIDGCPKNSSDSIAGNVSLAYNPNNYPNVTCNANSQCTTPFGNTFQLSITTANSTGSSDICLNVTPVTP